ncbi:DUF2508 family protein [Lacticaseibacillus zhaodongensis]|uniref:DUF2508 family protein n=1 Tax=Lacticaseibacillus zhaodongensis TaxID=2668065 RepID=UPI0012D2B3D6|nr:DUF2508 family protein [Lacticaseibacillus zhaodongensis]
MFGRKKETVKQETDGKLLELIYATRDQLAKERKLLNTATDVDTERQKASVALQEGLFDFLHRQARTRNVDPAQVASFSIRNNLERIN